MTQPPNPYAVTPLDDESSEHPIHFGGTLEREDLMMAMLDAPRRTGIRRFQYPVSLVLIMVVMVLIWMAGSSIASLIWPVIAYPLLPVWLGLLRRFSPAQRRRRQRIEESAKHIHVNHGWMNQDQFVIYDAQMYLRANWSFFSAAYLFDQHLVLPLAPDSNHRIVLPFSFFREPAEARQAIELVGEQTGYIVNSPPKDFQLAEEVISQPSPTAPFGVLETVGWDTKRWPFGSEDEKTDVFEIDLMAGQQGWKFVTTAISSVFIFAIWYFLPIWVASMLWLVSSYRETGDFSFLFDEIEATAIVLGPAAFILAFFLFSAMVASVRLRKGKSIPMEILMRPSGMHLLHENFHSWFRWSSLERIVIDESNAGWIIAENKDEARFPKNCFENDGEFERFVDALRELGPE